MLSRIPAVVVSCTAIALLCVAAFSFHDPAHSSALLELQGMVGGQVAHLTVVGPLREGLVPVVGTVGDQRVHGRVSLSKIQNPSPIPPAAQTLSSNYDAPIHLHVIIHPNGHIDGMPVALKDAATAKILRTLVNKFGGDSHSIVLDGDLRRYPQGHKPRDAIDIDSSDALPAPSSSSASAAAPHRVRLSQISGLDPWAQRAFLHAGETSGREHAPPTADDSKSGNPLNRLSESPDDGRLPPLPSAVASGSSVTSAADASIAAQFPLPQLQQDPQAGKANIDLDSGRPVAPNFRILMADARRVARERLAQYGSKTRPQNHHQELAQLHSAHSSAAVQSDYQRAFYAMKGEAAQEAVRQSRLGRLRGRSTHVLAAQKKKSKDAPPPEPNFLFFPVKKGSSGGSKSVPAEPMIKLLRLLHTITGSLNAVVKEEKMMQQEIQLQGAALAKLKPQRQHQQQQQPVVHAALAMSSVSFPSVANAELTAHPGDVLQVGNSQVVLPAGIKPGVYNVRQVDGSVELDAVQA